MKRIIVVIPHKHESYEELLEKVSNFFGGYITLANRKSLTAHYVLVEKGLAEGGEYFLQQLGLEYYVQYPYNK